MNNGTIINLAQRTITLQASALNGLMAYIGDDFVKAVHKISGSKGRLVISGIGKSAIIAQKIVATMNSTGTPALFMHAADAIHGDLGMIQQEDVVMVISKSGDSPEIKVLVPLVKNFGNTLIGIAGNMQSYLAEHADIVLNTTVEQEACPNNLAPTTSTTAQMVMGDALAVCLMEMKGFGSDQFAKFHPGGSLGKKLYMRVSHIIAKNTRPFVMPDASVKAVIIEITKSRLGAAVVLDASENIAGIITDGDIRRMLEKADDISLLSAKDIMTKHPKLIQKEELAAEALELMRMNNINQLVVMQENRYEGIIHLQDLIREGII